MSDADDALRSLRERLAGSGEDRLGKALSELLENPLFTGAVTCAFDARELAVHAQEMAMAVLNIPSAADIEKLTRRLRAMSQRMEGVEDALFRMEGALAGGAWRHGCRRSRSGSRRCWRAAVAPAASPPAAPPPAPRRPRRPRRAPPRAPPRGGRRSRRPRPWASRRQAGPRTTRGKARRPAARRGRREGQKPKAADRSGRERAARGDAHALGGREQRVPSSMRVRAPRSSKVSETVSRHATAMLGAAPSANRSADSISTASAPSALRRSVARSPWLGRASSAPAPACHPRRRRAARGARVRHRGRPAS